MTTAPKPYAALEREQEAFESRLDQMLVEHPGEFVVFHGGEPVKFFATYDEAYRAALESFGLAETFLVSEVKRRERQPTSISWEAGVMF